MANTIDLKGKRALITGADGDFGRSVALKLAAAGMKLALVGPGAEALVRTAALTGRPLDMLVLPADIARPRDMDDVLHVLEGHFKGLDALVNTLDGGISVASHARCLDLLRKSDCATIIDVNRVSQDPSEGALLRAATDAGVRVHVLVSQGTGSPDETAERIVGLIGA